MSELLYAERPEWLDITPLRQYENVTPLAPIFYSDEYRDATDYFRGIVRVGEHSERVLQLTEHIIRLNPAHYSAWQYRYKTLLALKSDLTTELRLMDELAFKYLKTYQVWHHRRLLLTLIRDSSDASLDAGSAELTFIARCLTEDTKNYHTWAYRQWLLAHFGEDALWAEEIPWVESLLKDDVRNNSAWHHRFFVVFLSGIRAGDEDRAAVVRRELRFAKHAIAQAPNNLSAWNYLRGVLDHAKMPYAELRAFVTPYTAARHTDEDEVIDLDNPLPSSTAHLPCAHAIEFLADIHQQEGQIEEAVVRWKSLADEHDTIRKKYWEFRIREARLTV